MTSVSLLELVRRDVPIASAFPDLYRSWLSVGLFSSFRKPLKQDVTPHNHLRVAVVHFLGKNDLPQVEKDTLVRGIKADSRTALLRANLEDRPTHLVEPNAQERGVRQRTLYSQV